MSSCTRRWFSLLAGLAAWMNVEAAEPPELRPFDSVVAYAKGHQIGLEGRTAEATNGVTILCALSDPTSTRQWIVTLDLPRDGGTGSNFHSGSGIMNLFSSTLYSSTGHDYRFADVPVPIHVRCVGPFEMGLSDGRRLRDDAAELVANEAYLSVGLYEVAKMHLRLREQGKRDPSLSYLFHPSYSKERILKDQRRAAEAGFTTDDERETAKSGFALIQFGTVAFRTPGVRQILEEVLDSPSLFSGAYTDTVWDKMGSVDGGAFGLKDRQVMSVPFSFKTSSTTSGTLFFTKPEGSLQGCAGIVGVLFDRSQKAPDKKLFMKLVFHRAAAE